MRQRRTYTDVSWYYKKRSNMGFEYFKKKKWIEITREERLFSAYLYFSIKENEGKFISWLNQKLGYEKYNPSGTWEVGYEVCLYRDYLKFFKEKRTAKFSRKRTFDLCLFSEKNIIIIEAKVQQAFKNKQVDDIVKDKIMIPSLLGTKDLNIDIVALCSSKYINSKSKVFEKFDMSISWQELSELYYNDIFSHADNLFKK